MSINWVMLSPTTPPTFTPLQNETTLYTSPPRTALNLHSLNKYPGKEPFAISASQGTLFLTNRRLIYLPAAPTPTLQSFAAPLLNTHDSHVAAPWIGPNVWTALVQPVQGGGIPAHHPALELKFTFKDGGAYDFHGRYETVKERLRHAVELARESGIGTGDGSETGRGRGGGSLAGVDVAAVHLEDLPAYEEQGTNVAAPGVSSSSTAFGENATRDESSSSQSLPPPPNDATSSASVGAGCDEAQATFSPPSEAPPGYEEVQRETVQDELERRMNHQQQD